MTWKSDLAALVNTFDDTAAARSETYTIATPYTYKLASTVASGGGAAIPAGWQAVPHGAPALPNPAAPISLVNRQTTRGLLAGSGTQYLYGLTYLTKYGETALGTTVTQTVTGTNNAVEFALPAYPNSTYNPVVGVGIYRSKAGAAGSLYPIGQIINPRITGWLDEMGDDQMQATTVAPGTNTSGLNVLGSPNQPVSVVGPLAAGGSGQWTEVPYGTAPSTEQYSVDYLSDTNGGTVYFASADAAKVVTVSYTAAIALTADFINSLVSPLRTLANQTMARGSKRTALVANVNADAGWVAVDSLSVTATGGCRLRIDIDCSIQSSSAGHVLTMDIAIDGITSVDSAPMGSPSSNGLFVGFAPSNLPIDGMAHLTLTTDVLAAGAHTVALAAYAPSSGALFSFYTIHTTATEIV